MWKPWQQPVGTSLWHIAFILCEVWGRVQVLLWEKMEPGPREPRTFQNGARLTTTAERLPVWLLSDHSPVKSQEAEGANRVTTCAQTHAVNASRDPPNSVFKQTLKVYSSHAEHKEFSKLGWFVCFYLCHTSGVQFAKHIKLRPVPTIC